MKRFLVVFILAVGTSVLFLSGASLQSAATEIEGNLYVSNTLGFSFRFPQGWLTDETSGGSSTLGGDSVVLTTSSGDSRLSAFFADLPKGLPLEDLAGTSEQWLNEHQGHLAGMNLELRGKVEQAVYGNTQFYRLKFRTKGRRNRVNHVVAVTVTPGKLIGFEAVAKNEKDATKAIDALQTISFFDAAFAAWQTVSSAATPAPDDLHGRTVSGTFPDQRYCVLRP